MASYLNWLKTDERQPVQRLFYFTAAQHALENIEKRRVKISKFSKCNDVFELAAFDLRDRGIRKKHRDWVKKFEPKVGLICLCEEWRGQLMWGHYGDSGSGTCMVFEVSKSLSKKVDYLPQRKVVTPDYQFPHEIDSDEFRAMCSTKSTHWNYEKEKRLLIELNNNAFQKDGELYFYPFNSAFRLVGIINGPKSKIEKKSFLEINGSDGGELQYFQCRASFRDFRMVVQQDQSLWV